ncbi:MAG: 50S ribosomal protein L25 [Planctomycetota bacterium]|nr:50S ribosomal protein L25 [Planctomycetota bacterium]
MSKKSEVLKAELRTRVGTRASRALRAEGRIPASMNADSTHGHVDLSIEEHGFLATRRRHTHLYEIEIGGKLEMAVVRELQWNTFGEQIVHIDFKRVQRDVKTESVVELEFTGHPKGGVLNHIHTHITVLCLPMDIPDAIEVPVGGLDTGGAILAKEIRLPASVTLVHPAADVKIAVVVVAAKPEAEPVAEAAAPAAPAAGTPAAPAS